jgi:hypothetical protein
VRNKSFKEYSECHLERPLGARDCLAPQWDFLPNCQ